MTQPALHGLVAEYETPTALVKATRRVHDAGYRCFDAYSPYPIEEVCEAMGVHHNRMPLIILIGAIIGCISGYSLQYFVSVIDYPLNIGGRPFNSIVAFLPITFEMTVLFAALCAVFGMIAMNGLPSPYHAMFNHPRFEAASQDGFFLTIEAEDPKFDLTETRRFLEETAACAVDEVEQ